MDKNVRGLLESKYVLFACEGTAEGVIMQTLYDSGAMIVPRDYVVKDSLFYTPYTRAKKPTDIVERFFGESYEVCGASGLLIARIVDSRSAKFKLPRRWEKSVVVESFYTRPEIEMLVIHAEGAYGDWQRAHRRDKQLRPNEFCKGTLKLPKIKEAQFLKSYWNPAKLIKAIHNYDNNRQHSNDEFSLGDLLA